MIKGEGDEIILKKLVIGKGMIYNKKKLDFNAIKYKTAYEMQDRKDRFWTWI